MFLVVNLKNDQTYNASHGNILFALNEDIFILLGKVVWPPKKPDNLAELVKSIDCWPVLFGAGQYIVAGDVVWADELYKNKTK